MQSCSGCDRHWQVVFIALRALLMASAVLQSLRLVHVTCWQGNFLVDDAAPEYRLAVDTLTVKRTRSVCRACCWIVTFVNARRCVICGRHM